MSWLWVHCGIPEAVFWRLTPAKVSSIISIQREKIKRDDYRAGIITTTIRSALGAKNLQVFDDFPEYKTQTVSRKSNLGAYLKGIAATQQQTKGGNGKK